MEGALPIIFLGVVLKIPVFFAIWLVWWASKSYDEAEGEAPGAEDNHGFRRWRRQPRRPRGPRRGGPHGGTAIAPPPRVRTATAVQERTRRASASHSQ